MFVIGLMGGIGTGKTEVTKVLGTLGAERIDADQVGHEVYRPGTEAWRRVAEEFGDDVLDQRGEIDRARLGAIVFEDERALGRLNAIVHPLIRLTIEARLDELSRLGRHVVVVEAALLGEAGWASLVDEVWVTVVPRARVVERVRRRNRLSEDAVLARIRAQPSQATVLENVDAVVDNSGTLEELREKVRALWTDRVPRV
jgi:dephospho-CoA kinase